jgi:hypothetical protein
MSDSPNGGETESQIQTTPLNTVNATLSESQLLQPAKNADADPSLDSLQTKTENTPQAPAPEQPQTLKQEIIYGLVDQIVNVEARQNNKAFTAEEIAAMKTMDFGTLNEHLVALTKEKINQDTQKNPNGYVEGNEAQPADLSKDKTAEELAKEDPKAAERVLQTQNQQKELLYGEHGILTKSLLELKKDPEKAGLSADTFAEGSTISTVLDSILKSQMDQVAYAYRKRNNIPLDQELTAEQQAELQAETDQKTAEFTEQKNTFGERAKQLGIDISVSSWEHSDFSTLMQTLFAVDGYSHGNSAYFPDRTEHGEEAVNATKLKEMIGWKTGMSSKEAQERWIKVFSYIAKELPDTQKSRLSNPEEWLHHTDKAEIMKDMDEFYNAIMMGGKDASVIAKKAFAEGLKNAGQDKDLGFGDVFQDRFYVSNDLITCIEALGKRQDFYNNFFGDVKA